MATKERDWEGTIEIFNNWLDETAIPIGLFQAEIISLMESAYMLGVNDAQS